MNNTITLRQITEEARGKYPGYNLQTQLYFYFSLQHAIFKTNNDLAIAVKLRLAGMMWNAIVNSLEFRN